MNSIFDSNSVAYLQGILNIGGVLLCYLPDNKWVDSYNYEVVSIVKIKQPDGDWVSGLCYRGKGGLFVRGLEMFPVDKWKFKVELGG